MSDAMPKGGWTNGGPSDTAPRPSPAARAGDSSGGSYRESSSSQQGTWGPIVPQPGQRILITRHPLDTGHPWSIAPGEGPDVQPESSVAPGDPHQPLTPGQEVD